MRGRPDDGSFFKTVALIIEDFAIAIHQLALAGKSAIEEVLSNFWVLAHFGRLLYEHWHVTLAILLIILALTSPFLFYRWREDHRISYGGMEILAGLVTIALILPWSQGVLDITSYGSMLDWKEALAGLGGVYLAVTGLENLHKGLAQAVPASTQR